MLKVSHSNIGQDLTFFKHKYKKRFQGRKLALKEVHVLVSVEGLPRSPV